MYSDYITEVTAKYFEVDINDIKGTTRSQKISLARQTAIYICRELTNQSFELIGEFFRRKHTTTMYAYEQIKGKINSQKNISSSIREIKQALKVL
jgi:chromosomal replication initiator protein